MSLFVVAISARPTLGPPEYLPAECSVCGRALQTSPEVRKAVEKGAEVACVTCALSGGQQRASSTLWDGGDW